MFPLLFRSLLFAAHSRRGRRLMFLGARRAAHLARSAQARRAYARAWRIASDPRPRRAAVVAVRSAAARVRSRPTRGSTGLRRVGESLVTAAAAVPARVRYRRR
jgi:hypothetical protein